MPVLRMARGSCLENMASLRCDTLMASQEHSNGAKPMGLCEHWAVSRMELAAFMLSPQIRHGRMAASLLALFRPLLSV